MKSKKRSISVSSNPAIVPSSAEHLLEPVLSTEAMRAADRRAIEEHGVPGCELMERAGRTACAFIEARFGEMKGRRVLVLAGKGNNGGDGLVVARILSERGADVTAVTLATEENTTEDTAAKLKALREVEGVIILPFTQMEDVRALNPPEMIVDALLGVGTIGELREPVSSLARWINEQAAPVIAMDVPTGLNSDTGEAAENTVRATATVAMGALKIGLLLNEGPALSGSVDVAEIGIPEAVLREEATAFRATDAWVGAALPRRAHDAHKYSSGRVLAVVGSRMFTGAAVLATSACYRMGAGAVVCCTPESAQQAIDAHALEVMVAAQKETDDGTLAIMAYDDIVSRLERSDAVLVGCGLGRSRETARLVQALLRRINGPAVIDADGLNALAGRTEKLAELSSGRMVLTPHMGEFKRLVEDLTRDDMGHRGVNEADPLELVRTYATAWNVVLVLKGMPSVVGAPDGHVLIGPPGNPALATAGTGDVLAGSIAGLLAQGMKPEHAAVCALHVGTAAVERYSATRGASSMMASDLLTEIPFVLHERFSG